MSVEWVAVLVAVVAVGITSTGLAVSGFRRLADQIVTVDHRLADQIAAVDHRLTTVDQRFKDQIAGVDQRLTDQIAGVDQRLTDQIAAGDQRLADRIAGVEQQFIIPCGPDGREAAGCTGRDPEAPSDGMRSPKQDPVTPPTVTPFAGATLGAVIPEIDLTRLSGQTWRIVEEAFLEHAVLVFPGQHLSADARSPSAGASARSNSCARTTGRRCSSATGSWTAACCSRTNSASSHCAATRAGTWTAPTCRSPRRRGCCPPSRCRPAAARPSSPTWRAAYDALDAETRDGSRACRRVTPCTPPRRKSATSSDSGSGYGYHDKGRADPPAGQDPSGHRAQGAQLGAPHLSHPRHGRCRRAGAGRRPAATRMPAAAGVHPSLAPGDLLLWDNRCVLHGHGPTTEASRACCRPPA